MDQFNVLEIPLALGYQRDREEDLYLSLVGEVFDSLRSDNTVASDWALLANALAQYGAPDRADKLRAKGISPEEALLFAAASFYFGGFPASAYLTLKRLPLPIPESNERACFELLCRARNPATPITRELVAALAAGNMNAIASIEESVLEATKAALSEGPDKWVPLRLLQSLVHRFRGTNLRAVLPEGESQFWSPLVAAFIRRGAWEFFPSQILAIQRGLLTRTETFSLQMPTGAGKTAICETLLYYHLKKHPEGAAVLLVPYRSLASELRGTLVRNLNAMGISSRCAYGGTVPSSDEVQAFDETQALIATPETLSGILSANAEFMERISLVICDEGHLLDAPGRGVGLELLLARMKTREAGIRRYVFVSAIVPNIEEINLWLGGVEDSVVKSDYRPAIAEFSVLRPTGVGPSSPLDLEMHPHEDIPIRYLVEGFLRREDFRWLNPVTGNNNTYGFATLKTRAIAAARKALPMGASVVFCANKSGNQGAIGLAEEFLEQIAINLPMPKPIDFSDQAAIGPVLSYLTMEYGPDWVGTRSLLHGVALHHGDIPQETREVLEQLLRDAKICFGICTNTLAEGVNLPIRTLVLYSVQRVHGSGVREDLLTRDIKNLVGRAGRAGATTKGLVICANSAQWHLVEPVARQEAGESVVGALRQLIESLSLRLAVLNVATTNEVLELLPEVNCLIDGIDSTLIDLAAAEIGEDELVGLASNLAAETFASRQMNESGKQFLRTVFELRARRVFAVQAAGRLDWIKETGTKLRLVAFVEAGLLQVRQQWDNIADPADPEMLRQIVEWAWGNPEFSQAVREAYHVEENVLIDDLREPFVAMVSNWVSGASFLQIAGASGVSVDEVLNIHARLISYALQTIVEQGIALLQKLVEAQGQTVAPAVLQFPELLRFGAPTFAGCALASGGVWHRRAYVALGITPEVCGHDAEDFDALCLLARQLVEGNSGAWRAKLGDLVFERTSKELTAMTSG